MKKIGLFFAIILFCSTCISNAEDILSKADEKCVKLNLSKEEKQECLEMYKKAVDKHPESYEANWKMARAYRAYTVHAKRNKLQNWQKICRDFGKKCMDHAEKAVQKKSERVEGHLYYGLCIDSYSKGVSILTAINQGLKDKALKHFSRAYSLDKEFLNGAPVLALACLWDSLPWPLRDKEKALKYYREAYEVVPKNTRVRTKLQVNMGSFLLETGRDRKKAKRMLKLATQSNSTHFTNKAREILQEYQ